MILYLGKLHGGIMILKYILFSAYLQLKFNWMSYISSGHFTRSKNIYTAMGSDVLVPSYCIY